MSEIKGQLLGIVLVVTIFGAISGILYTAFQTSAQDVASKITDNTVADSALLKF
jgi:hypothetical protein